MSNVADFLPRLSQVKGEFRNVGEEYACFVSRKAVPNAMKFETIRDLLKQNSDSKQILNGNFSRSNLYFRFHNQLSVVDGVLMQRLRSVMPSNLRKQTLDLAHEGHQGNVKTKTRLRGKVWWPGDCDTEKLVKPFKPCQLVALLLKSESAKPTPLPNGLWQDACCGLEGTVFIRQICISRWQEVAILKSVTTEKNHSCVKYIVIMVLRFL